MKLSIIALFFLALGATPVWSQSAKSLSPAELAAHSGADRERILFDGAKREGHGERQRCDDGIAPGNHHCSPLKP